MGMRIRVIVTHFTLPMSRAVRRRSRRELSFHPRLLFVQERIDDAGPRGARLHQPDRHPFSMHVLASSLRRQVGRVPVYRVCGQHRPLARTTPSSPRRQGLPQARPVLSTPTSQTQGAPHRSPPPPPSPTSTSLPHTQSSFAPVGLLYATGALRQSMQPLPIHRSSTACGLPTTGCTRKCSAAWVSDSEPPRAIAVGGKH
ncbi:hypothetical protein B0H14DRAFT_172863 [Mycena olivaceomarginata]|nr:hypothetical protein B0H14DRAFT_172863 [Mycena olivaceomarginata]